LAFLTMVCLLWAGMVLGISFLEAPVKFTAPSLTLAVGLDVGRHVFAAFHKVELLWAFFCVLLLWSGVRIPRAARWFLVAALGVLLVQSLWLLPVLDARVTLILQGQTPPPAPYHWLYVASEVVKLIGLLGCGALCLRGAPFHQNIHAKSH
jgi:hypothetical protein